MNRLMIFAFLAVATFAHIPGAMAQSPWQPVPMPQIQRQQQNGGTAQAAKNACAQLCGTTTQTCQNICIGQVLDQRAHFTCNENCRRDYQMCLQRCSNY